MFSVISGIITLRINQSRMLFLCAKLEVKLQSMGSVFPTISKQELWCIFLNCVTTYANNKRGSVRCSKHVPYRDIHMYSNEKGRNTKCIFFWNLANLGMIVKHNTGRQRTRSDFNWLADKVYKQEDHTNILWQGFIVLMPHRNQNSI